MENVGHGWLYARKSAYHGRRKARGKSVAQQLDGGRKWCAANNIKVAGEFVDDDTSASPQARDTPRESYEEMIALIAAGTIKPRDTIVTWESSRLYRDLAVYVQLRDACADAGVYWSIDGRMYDMGVDADRMFTAYEALRSEGEVRDLTRRVRQTLQANAAAGRPHSRSLYGYRRVYDSATGDLSAVVIDEKQAAVVRWIYRQVCEHKTLAWIMADLNRRRVPSPSGTIRDRQVVSALRRLREAARMDPEIVAQRMGWPDGRRVQRIEAGSFGVRPADVARLLDLYDAPPPERQRLTALAGAAPQWRRRNTVRQLLLNPAYIGKRAHRGEVVADAIWPPIISEPIFRAAQLILQDPGRVSGRPGAIKQMVSGVATCGHVDDNGVVCGGNVSASRVTRLDYAIYKCDERQHFGVRAQPVDDYVTLHVVKRFARPDAARLFAVTRDADGQVARLEADRAGWRADLDEATRAAALPRSDPARISLTRLAQLETLIAPQIAAADRKLGELQANPLLADLIRPTEAEVFAEWKGMETSQRRAVLAAVMEVEISPPGRGRRNVPVEEYVRVGLKRGGD
jgi:site-specific DNA recombinase